MKYFTAQWHRDTITAEMCFQMRKDSKAGAFSEKLFTSLYESQKNWYVKHLKRAAKHLKQPFDPKAAEAEYEANYKENLDYIRANLPAEILNKVADHRVLALGVAEYDVLMEITRFCGGVNHRCELVREEYEASLEALAEQIGWLKINMLGKIANAPIASVSLADGRLTVVTSPEITEIACTLTLSDADANLPEWESLIGTVILYHELLDEGNGRYSLSLLCEKEDGSFLEATAHMKDIEIEEC